MEYNIIILNLLTYLTLHDYYLFKKAYNIAIKFYLYEHCRVMVLKHCV